MNLRFQKKQFSLMLCCIKQDCSSIMKECSTTQGGRVLSNLYKHMDVSFIFYSYFLMKNQWFRGFLIQRILWCNRYLQLPGAELQHLSQQCPKQRGTCSEEDWAPSSVICIGLNSAAFSDKVKFQQCRISCRPRLRLLRTSASCKTVPEYVQGRHRGSMMPSSYM